MLRRSNSAPLSPIREDVKSPSKSKYHPRHLHLRKLISPPSFFGYAKSSAMASPSASETASPSTSSRTTSPVASPRLPPPPPPPVPRRKVSFYPVVKNRRIPHINDLPPDIVRDTWLTPEDYASIRQHCVDTVRRMMRSGSKSLNEEDDNNGQPGNPSVAVVYCSRGLEGKTKAGAARRRGHKLDAIAAVLDEQNMQWQEDIYDDEAIAEVYHVYASHCQEMAHQVGLNDQDIVRRLWDEDVRRPGPIDLDEEHDIASLCSLSLDGSDDDDSNVEPDCLSPKDPSAQHVLVKLRDIVVSRGLRAAVLREILAQEGDTSETEGSLPYSDTTVNVLSPPQIRDPYFAFSTASSSSSTSMPSLEPLVSDDEYYYGEEDEDDDDNSSVLSGYDDAAAALAFTLQLQDICESQRKRQAVLNDIDQAGRGRRDRNVNR